MKFRTTRTAVKENGGIILNVKYCGLQSLLRFKEPQAYTSGIYGWNADIYNIDGVTIVTGYRPFGNYHNGDLVAEYEAKAHNIATDYQIDWETRKNDVNKLLDEFVNKVYKLATAK
nr:MAG TPA: hypothetical protein [Caudoviricetes sp.]